MTGIEVLSNHQKMLDMIIYEQSSILTSYGIKYTIVDSMFLVEDDVIPPTEETPWKCFEILKGIVISNMNRIMEDWTTLHVKSHQNETETPMTKEFDLSTTYSKGAVVEYDQKEWLFDPTEFQSKYSLGVYPDTPGGGWVLNRLKYSIKEEFGAGDDYPISEYAYKQRIKELEQEISDLKKKCPCGGCSCD